MLIQNSCLEFTQCLDLIQKILQPVVVYLVVKTGRVTSVSYKSILIVAGRYS